MIKGSGVYAIKNLVNGGVYIGSTTRSFNTRWREHRKKLSSNRHCNSYLQRSWNKYGENRFEFVVLEELNNRTSIIEREQHWLDKFRSIGDVYNIGDYAKTPMLGYSHTDEARRKMSAAVQGEKHGMHGKKHTDEARQKMRDAHKGRSYKPLSDEHRRKLSVANKGKRHTDETRRKLSEIGKGRRHTEEARRKMSIARKGCHFTDEHRQNLSIARRNRPPLSEETRRKISIANKGKVGTNAKSYPAFVSPDGIVHPAGINLLAFCRKHNLFRSCMSRMVRGICKQHKGWRLA